MKAKAIEAHFNALLHPRFSEKTVDGIIVGDPEKEIRRILVTWMPSFEAMRTAVQREFDMMVCHEPTFYAHMDERTQAGESDVGREKKGFIERSGLVVLRNHDLWDLIDKIGIPWAWAQFLEFGGAPVATENDGYLHRYDIEPLTVDELARRIARRTATIGEPSVQVIGDGTRRVSKVGVGTGCACGTESFQKLGCDVSIVCDDGSVYWRTIQMARDKGHPVIRVNHGTSEEPGMATLTQYINDTFAGVTAEHLPHGCCFRLVAAG